MASGHSNGSHLSPAARYQAVPPPGQRNSPFREDALQNGASQPPDLLARSPGLSTSLDPNLAPSPVAHGRDPEMEDRRAPDRTNTPRTKSGRSASSQRLCKKCGLQLTGQFVRALDGTFHLDCFRCRVC